MDGTEVATREPGWLARSREFLTATRQEMRKVIWPTRPELLKATRMIIALSVLLGAVIGLMDFVLQKILVEGIARMAR